MGLPSWWRFRRICKSPIVSGGVNFSIYRYQDFGNKASAMRGGGGRVVARRRERGVHGVRARAGCQAASSFSDLNSTTLAPNSLSGQSLQLAALNKQFDSFPSNSSARLAPKDTGPLTHLRASRSFFVEAKAHTAPADSLTSGEERRTAAAVGGPDGRVPLKLRIRPTSATRSRTLPTPIQWQPMCTRLWPTERNGRKAHPDLLQVGTNGPAGRRVPSAFAGRLRRAQTLLRTLGIEIVFGREGRLGTRTIRITAMCESRSHNNVSTVSTVSRVSDNGNGMGLNRPLSGWTRRCNCADDADRADAK